MTYIHIHTYAYIIYKIYIHKHAHIYSYIYNIHLHTYIDTYIYTYISACVLFLTVVLYNLIIRYINLCVFGLGFIYLSFENTRIYFDTVVA